MAVTFLPFDYRTFHQCNLGVMKSTLKHGLLRHETNPDCSRVSHCLPRSIGLRFTRLISPNILFLLSDDQSWNGLSCQMHPDIPGSAHRIIETPYLEKMAKEGMRFSAAYSPSPVCSPTRISLQTGKSPAQLHCTEVAPTMTAADVFRLISPTIKKSIPK